MFLEKKEINIKGKTGVFNKRNIYVLQTKYICFEERGYRVFHNLIAGFAM